MNKKNQSKHKLKSYNVKNKDQIEIRANLMLVDRRISYLIRSVSIEEE